MSVLQFFGVALEVFISYLLYSEGVSGECEDALGMETGAISDSHITASSEWAGNHAAVQGRLNFKAGGGKTGGWSAGSSDVNQWLQVDLGCPHKVTGFATQGRNGHKGQWVTAYKLQYSLDGYNFYYYKEFTGSEKQFDGNTDPDTVSRYILGSDPITARYIRFRPTAWHRHISMRVELYGCQEPCIVKISANPFINKVTAPPEMHVGCFEDADNLEVLEDFTNKINWNNTNEVVKKCAKLARDKDYELFALGRKGLCLSGADMEQKYHIGGTTDKASSCKDGIGMENSVFVYSLDPAPNLQPLGCYRDRADDRALPVLFATFRGGQINWTKIELVVNQCARVAYDKDYEYFAVQHYGECFGGNDDGKHYAKHGKSSNCWEFDKKTGFGVGKDNTNFVYRIK